MTLTAIESGGSLRWPGLTAGRLIKRYKRFLADVLLDDGRTITAHCPNSGSMLGCSQPGRPVYLSRHSSPARKYPYTWEMIQMPGSLVGINTLVPNRLVAASIREGLVPELEGYDEVRAEVKYGTNSRIDLLLTGVDKPCFVEIKNCTLVENNTAFFPDAVTARGLKHLRELQHEIHDGNRAVMFFMIQRMDALRFKPAFDIDPAYSAELLRAVEAGVEILCYDTKIDFQSIRLRAPVAVNLDPGR